MQGREPRRWPAWRWWAWLGVAALAVPTALAQPGQPQSPQAGEPDAQLGARRQAVVGAQEQLSRAQQIVAKGEQLRRRVMAMIAEARREKDVIRITCLDDKLTQINANLRSLSEHVERLQDAARAGDPDRRNHEFAIIVVIDQKLSTLEQEAMQCIGQEVFETGVTQVTVTVDVQVQQETPGQGPAVGGPGPSGGFLPPPYSVESL